MMYGLQLKANNLDNQYHFYSQILGFPLLSRTSSYLRTEVGTTVLDFEKVDNLFLPYCFRVDIPIDLFNATMDDLSAQINIGKRRSIFHPQLQNTWYIYDTSRNIIELSPSRIDTIRITGIEMIVNDLTEVSQQLQHLGLNCLFIDQFRCILQNPYDSTVIALIQPKLESKSSTSKIMTVPTIRSSINATVCLQNTPHFLYMVNF